VLQGVAGCCKVLKGVAVFSGSPLVSQRETRGLCQCHINKCVTSHIGVENEHGGRYDRAGFVAGCCRVLQCVAVCCSVLQCVAVCCNTHKCGGRCDGAGRYYRERLWAFVNFTYMNVHVYQYHVPCVGRESTRRDK